MQPLFVVVNLGMLLGDPGLCAMALVLFVKSYFMGTSRLRLIFSWLRTFLYLLIWIVPVVYLVYSLVIVWFVSGHDYAFLLQWYSRNRPDAFDVETIARDCMTGRWHDWIKTHRLVLLGLISAVLLLYLVFWRPIFSFISRLVDEIARIFRFLGDSFRACNRKERGWLFILFGGILAYRIYLLVAIPLEIDEVTSYVYFVRQGFWFTLINYPIPNNHILLNAICSLLNKASFLPAELVMRLPSMTADLFLFYGIFCLFRYWGGFQRAVIVVAGVAFCHLLSFYAVQGRGYQLQVLCVVVSGMSCWAYFFSSEWSRRSGYPLFILSSVAGFYINPLFVYHFLAMIFLCSALFIRRRQYGDIAIFARALVTIAVLTGILYLPLILGSSWQAITDNRYVSAGRPWHNLADDLGILVYDVKYDFYYGMGSVFLLAGGVVLSLILYFGNRLRGRFYHYAFTYFVAVLLSLACIILYKKIYPLERSLCFLVLAFNVFFVNVCYDMARRYLSARGVLVALSVFILVKVAGSVRLLYWDSFALRNNERVRLYPVIQKDITELFRLHPSSWQITDSEDFYPDYLRLNLAREGRNDRVVFSRAEAIGDVIFLPEAYSGSAISLKGYTRWAEKRRSGISEGEYLTIYVSDDLLRRSGVAGR